MSKYTIGVDFGTLSVRAVLLDAENGNEISSAEVVYPHEVMSEALFNGVRLEENFALQHPKDYIDGLSFVVHEVVRAASVTPDMVVGIGIDFTACTVLPVSTELIPLCYMEKFTKNPYAYAKLWKHHGASEQAERITALARSENADWLDGFGGTVSSEWILPKILETVEKAPEVYDEAAYFVEAGDYMTWLLTGERVRSTCMAGFKGL